MLRLSDHALAMASVETAEVKRRVLNHELRTVGRIEFNESSLATIAPRFDGYTQRLFVSVTGVTLRKGDHLAEVYSPEVLLAQKELLLLLDGGASTSMVDLARRRLALLGLTEAQVQALAERKELTDHVTLYSPVGGTVIEKGLVDGAAFKAGDVLYRIADLDTVWAQLEVFEPDLPWVAFGQSVRLTTESYPGRIFDGRVSFVRPSVGDTTRTISVPVVIENSDHALLPGMFVSATINATLRADGHAASTQPNGQYSCYMHPQISAVGPGECPKCGMPLELIHTTASASHHHTTAPPEPLRSPSYVCPMRCEGEKHYPDLIRCPVCKMKLVQVEAPSAPETVVTSDVPEDANDVVAVPATAVLDSGARHIVYVQKKPGLFEPRELTLGPKAGEYFLVISGLSPGERVAIRGGFFIDSQFQITGHPSLLYPGGLVEPPVHAHGGTASTAAPQITPSPVVPPAGSSGHKH
ncbi:MAG: efflux RND transporter periplasmic adaptor subunit [Myxococcales bacterium]|nr:efflux RND transporter periplasmic adaptor subunit [Myxococcales bacterium]